MIVGLAKFLGMFALGFYAGAAANQNYAGKVPKVLSPVDYAEKMRKFLDGNQEVLLLSLLGTLQLIQGDYRSASESESQESQEQGPRNPDHAYNPKPATHYPQGAPNPVSGGRTANDIAKYPRVVAGSGREIKLEEVVSGDVKQTGTFGGQNFKIFEFEGQQMAVYMFSPFSIYFADEAQDNEVENEGDDASSKNQYLSQSKYGQQRGAGPSFLYQPNFDNRRRLNLIRRLLRRRNKKDPSSDASTQIPITIPDSSPVFVNGDSREDTKELIAKLLKYSAKKGGRDDSASGEEYGSRFRGAPSAGVLHQAGYPAAAFGGGAPNLFRTPTGPPSPGVLPYFG
ncbi:unnamed protein product [Notodromas monacha]|uniref:Uncharacterized protein n=1 Tax=Notodromas monacha TaxID=399045 RepID=A0A7R9GG21_9CRUS|nr:unnamed protein product [Notodromas monacha]CAG0919928.1 unnamed protein product [Notodromas monacha]